MEAPLNAREFIKRFHLPQLVRIISSTTAVQQDEDRAEDQQVELTSRVGQSTNTITRGHSSTSISSSFVALGNEVAERHQRHRPQQQQQQQHEKSDWIYRGASTQKSQRQVEELCSAEQEEESCAGFRSLFAVSSHQQDETTSGFRSISAWSSAHMDCGQVQQVDKQLLVRMPRASLIQQQQQHLQTKTKCAKKSVEFNEAANGDVDKWAAGSGNAQPTSGLENSIRLTPPSKRPTLNKLSLNQPFLLYKAYKKLELCAYVIDLKNELNDKSGDPIYFPKDYPGWFSISPTDNQTGSDRCTGMTPRQDEPLESIDQVYRTKAQIFITRDELLGYQLPKKLSNLTKLKNNQLLPIPLAVSLDTIGQELSSPSKNSSSSSSSAKAQSIIKPLVIKSGQALRICGIYEDVLQRMEGTKENHLELRRPPDPPPSIHYHQMTHQQQTAAAVYQQQVANQQLYQQVLASNSYQQQTAASHLKAIQQHHQHHHQNLHKKTQKLLKLRYSNSRPDLRQTHNVLPEYAAPHLIYGHPQIKQPQVQMLSSKVIKQQKDKAAIQQQQSPPATYARCILLNKRSVDQLTGCASCIQLERSSVGDNNRTPTDCHLSAATSRRQVVVDNNVETGEAEEEIEVLIPIYQRGRFYVCATNRNMHQLQCYPTVTFSSNLVFKLSQIISLLSYSSKRPTHLDGNATTAAPELAQQQQKRKQQQQQSRKVPNCCVQTTTPAIKLPLTVQLVMGPRPANFSPSMFGSSSTMESYFCTESNVAGHSLGCKYNKSDFRQNKVDSNHQMATGEQQTSSSDQNFRSSLANAGQPVCGCAQRLTKTTESSSSSESYGMFSAILRIEQMVERDVLLACTIKRDPLIHLDLFSDDSFISAGSFHTVAAHHRKTGGVEHHELHSSQHSTLTDQTSRLVALRETNDGNQQRRCQLAKADRQADTKSMGKSSFSRLRACRSLISLNGRRNKRRPNIPSCMLTSTSHLVILPDGSPGGASQQVAKSDSLAQQFEVDSSELSNSLSSSPSSIVIIEFDCNDNELQFVRTFVESSIPTSTIPDLVLNRMEFCAKNSYDWERQLKLSYKTLSQDFDSCQHQMEQNRKQILADRHQQQLKLASSAAAAANNNNSNLARSLQRSANLSSTTAGFLVGGHSTSVGSQDSSVNSTASSRSSSGVSSSSGDRHKRVSAGSRALRLLSSTTITANDKAPGAVTAEAVVEDNNSSNCEATISSISTSEAELTIAASGTSGSGVGGSGSNRLIRLMHKILPPFNRQLAAGGEQCYNSTTGGNHLVSVAAAAAADTTTDAGQQQQRRLMDELNGRFKRELVVDDSRAQAGKLLRRQQQQQTDDATLMNAQKIHRKLLTGSERHLALQAQSCERFRDQEEEQNEEEDDSGSHLYESLERLNEARLNLRQRTGGNNTKLEVDTGVNTTGAAAGSRSAVSAVSAAAVFRNNVVGSRRVGIGKSIEFLVGHNHLMSALVSRSLADRDRGSLGQDNDYEEDEWWRNSTKQYDDELTGNARFRLPKTRLAVEGDRQIRGKQRNFSTAAKAASQKFDTYAMEPVSIEACNDEFVSMVENEELLTMNDDDDESIAECSELSYPSSGTGCRSEPAIEQQQQLQRCSRSLIEENDENIYVNLAADNLDKQLQLQQQQEQKSRSSFDLDRRARQRLVGRMERKLMKIRGRRYGSVHTANILDADDDYEEEEDQHWHSERELSPSDRELEADADAEEGEFKLHSINLPTSVSDEFMRSQRRRSRDDQWIKATKETRNNNNNIVEHSSKRIGCSRSIAAKSSNSFASIDMQTSKELYGRPLDGAPSDQCKTDPYREVGLINSLRRRSTTSSFTSSSSSSSSSSSLSLTKVEADVCEEKLIAGCSTADSSSSSSTQSSSHHYSPGHHQHHREHRRVVSVGKGELLDWGEVCAKQQRREIPFKAKRVGQVTSGDSSGTIQANQAQQQQKQHPGSNYSGSSGSQTTTGQKALKACNSLDDRRSASQVVTTRLTTLDRTTTHNSSAHVTCFDGARELV